MTYLKFFAFENDIEFDDSYINIIEIENKDLFRRIVYLLNRFSNYKEQGEEIILVNGENRLEISQNMLVVNDFFNIDINTNKILKYLYLEIEKQYNSDYGEENILKNLESIFINIQEVLTNFDFELDYKREMKITEILKAVGLKFNNDFYDDPMENLICLFDLTAMFKLYKIITLINIKSFLNDEEIVELYKAAKYRGIYILLVEHYQDEKLREYEKKLYVDNDYDEFEMKF